MAEGMGRAPGIRVAVETRRNVCPVSDAGSPSGFAKSMREDRVRRRTSKAEIACAFAVVAICLSNRATPRWNRLPQKVMQYGPLGELDVRAAIT